MWEVTFADNGWMDWKCPVCGFTENIDVHVKLDYDYCPSCGTFHGKRNNHKSLNEAYKYFLKKYSKHKHWSTNQRSEPVRDWEHIRLLALHKFGFSRVEQIPPDKADFVIDLCNELTDFLVEWGEETT